MLGSCCQGRTHERVHAGRERGVAKAVYKPRRDRGHHCSNISAALGDFDRGRIAAYDAGGDVMRCEGDPCECHGLNFAAQTPSRYAFPPFFEFPFQERAAGINGAAEVRRIRASRPHFIVTSVWVYDVDSSTLVAELADLSSSYRLSYAANGVMILRRRDLAR